MISINILLAKLQLIFLMTIRISAILISIPIFESKDIPILFKLVLSVSISIVLFPLLNLNNVQHTDGLIILIFSGIKEIIVGIVIGLSVKFIFTGIQMAGQLAGYQMGLAIANILDPNTNEQVPLLAQINNLIGLLVFLTINAHHWFLKALAESFHLVSPLNIFTGNFLTFQIIQMSGKMFIIAMKIGAPVISAMLISNFTIGLVARTLPQINVFLVAMPLNITIGFLFFAISLPYLSLYLIKIFNEFFQEIIIVLSTLTLK